MVCCCPGGKGRKTFYFTAINFSLHSLKFAFLELCSGIVTKLLQVSGLKESNDISERTDYRLEKIKSRLCDKPLFSIFPFKLLTQRCTKAVYHYEIKVCLKQV